ncbi:MAG: ImmA/IrrE family metallo-endopeptidase [Methanobrevibacter sp.]|jgi:Zn-dependent peptidase ImmA (M78 family)|nr:ImmA/IrrE family metallo-endopeptidase [Methanobrevibacter sp.]
MESEKLKANNEWLVWARETAHYNIEDLAKKIKKPTKTIKEWESTGLIRWNDLEELSEHYQRPSHIFFSKNKPIYEEYIPPDFRTFNNKKEDVTPNMAFEIRNAKYKRNVLLNLEDESNDFTFPYFELKNLPTNDINKVTDFIREKLSMNRAKISLKKLNHWISKIESLGVLIFEFYGIDPDELRGYALYYDKLPIIGINHREFDNPKKFTLFHELAHLILKKDGMSNLSGYFLNDDEEATCNKIAADILVPSKLFRSLNEEFNRNNFDDMDVELLSKKFKVSKEVIIRKALDLNLINKKEYNKKINEFQYYLTERKKNQLIK